MKANSERGVALVITLVMLALVTFMAVVFLAVSRREKTSVTVQADIVTARYMAEAALARAQSEVASRILANSNLFAYDFLVSTNFSNPLGFDPSADPRTNILSVNYDYRVGGAPMRAGGSDLQGWIQNISRLQIDPRPPVFYPSTNKNQPDEFRFYIDFNRNGQFEPTGVITNGRAPNGLSLGFLDEERATNYHVGDPQWIGVLEYPDKPHSETNRFVGRYAFMVLPAGRSLDLNFIHNAAKRLQNNMSRDSYMRNQGVGSWEINLAGFLAELNTNNVAVGNNVGWVPNTLGYNFSTNTSFSSSGTAFDDARMLLSHRYEGNLLTLKSAQNFYATNNPFPYTNIDYYSDGPTAGGAADSVNQPWSGSYSTNGFYDIQELFNPNLTSPAFVNRLTNRSTVLTAYDRYTFYRLLAQMGTDSRPAASNLVYFPDHLQHYTNRLHLHYEQQPLALNQVANPQANFIPWDYSSADRALFFHSAADRMIRATLDPFIGFNGSVRNTNFFLGGLPVRDTFSVTNIQLLHLRAGQLGLPFYVTNNEYTATVHRLLQLAANIHDATTVNPLRTTNDYPSVFRPVFMRTATNLIIRGYVEENDANAFLSRPWMSIEQAARSFGQGVVVSNINLFGVPLVIGAKKGYPNFNKMVMQTLANVSRRLEIRKSSPLGLPTATNQMFMIGVSNRFGIEGWNSYAADFNRNLELRVTNHVEFWLSNRVEGTSVPLLLTNHFWNFGTTRTLNSWPGSATLGAQTTFLVPVDTNVATLPDSFYLAKAGRLIPATTNITGLFEPTLRVPQWTLRMTNRLQYILIDRSPRSGPPRIIDYVSLDHLATDIDLTRGMTGDTNAAGGGIVPSIGRGAPKPGQVTALTDGDMWNPAHLDPKNLDSPTRGIVSQIGVSEGIPYLGEGEWRNATGSPQDKTFAIQQFQQFMRGQTTNLFWQVPFTPSRRLYQRTSWEANDPLVHYTAEDLTEPVLPGSTNLLAGPIPFNYPFDKDSMLRQLNTRFRPWGGKPNKDATPDPYAYAMTVKDPLIRRSDDWNFPTNHFPNLGWLGRVHRGSPWQTMYLKAAVDPLTGKTMDVKSWGQWSGSYGTHPTNDWRLFDLFTVAPNENASRGLLGVNQTNVAAWSAVLSGVSVLTNITSDAAVGPKVPPRTREMFVAPVTPNTPQIQRIVDGIGRSRRAQTNGTFRTLGDVLSTPELTVASPYLNLSAKQIQQGLDDTMVERIPQQILSLLKPDEPRVVVYAFGQSLKPADRSLVTMSTVSPPIFNLCTNYQVTGEYMSKTVLRLEPMAPEPVANNVNAQMAQKLRAIVESYTVLQPD